MERLIGAVEATGYHAHPTAPPATHSPAAAGHHRNDEATDVLARRLRIAVIVTVPVAVLAIGPPLQFSGREWFAFGLSTPVLFYAGIGFHRATISTARYGAATMDTLISLGTIAAWAWSTVVLVAGLDADTYFEVAAVITTLILLGRYLEARAKRRSGEAIRKLLELGAKEARVLRDGDEILVPIGQLIVGDRFVVRPGEKIATDGIVEDGASAVDQSMLTGESVPVEVAVDAEVAGRHWSCERLTQPKPTLASFSTPSSATHVRDSPRSLPAAIAGQPPRKIRSATACLHAR